MEGYHLQGSLRGQNRQNQPAGVRECPDCGWPHHRTKLGGLRSTSDVGTRGQSGHNKFISKYFPLQIPFSHPSPGHCLHLSHAWQSKHVQSQNQSVSCSAGFTSPLSNTCTEMRHFSHGSTSVSLEDKTEDWQVVQLCGMPGNLQGPQLNPCLS